MRFARPSGGGGRRGNCAAALWLSLTTTLLAPSCARPGERVPAVTPGLAGFAPGLSLADLDDGRRILITDCNRCHKVYEPASRSPRQWETILPVMIGKARLNPTQAAHLRGYITASLHASEPREDPRPTG